MHRTALLCFMLALAATIVAMGRTGHVKEPATEETAEPEKVHPPAAPAESTDSQPAATAAEAARALDIVELREQMGGSLLNDTLLSEGDVDATTEQEFLQAVQGQLAESNTEESTQQCEERYQQLLTQPNQLEHVPHAAAVNPQRIGAAGLPTDQSESATPDLSAVLRTAGRHLDTHANDLEDMGQYDRGDQLRLLARRIRQVAREVRHDSPPSEMARELPRSQTPRGY